MYSAPLAEDLTREADCQLSAKAVRAAASKAAFGQKLITNSLRGLVAEVIVASTLTPEWAWCAADWAGWDFQRPDGLKLEVKQSAARQTWTNTDPKSSVCRFDIKPRTGAYEGLKWYPRIGRQAEIYVFAHHFEDGEDADHCDPAQWRFFVVRADQLVASAKSIGLGAVEKLAKPCIAGDLSRAVAACAAAPRSNHPA